jgi:hypothetical protein
MRCIEFLRYFFFEFPISESEFRFLNFSTAEFEKIFTTGIFGIKNEIGIPLPMGVPEIGTKNWNSQPSGKVGIEQFMVISDTTEFIIFDGIVCVGIGVWIVVEGMASLLNVPLINFNVSSFAITIDFVDVVLPEIVLLALWNPIGLEECLTPQQDTLTNIRGSCSRVPARFFFLSENSSGNALSQNSKLRVVIWQDRAPKILPRQFFFPPPPPHPYTGYLQQLQHVTTYCVR